MTEVIHKDHTLDRPEFRVTAEEVFDAMKALHEENDIPAFSTNEIANQLVAMGKFRGIPHARIERSVRAGVFWLCEREVAYVAGEIMRKTSAGCFSKPFLYALYPGRTWSKKQREIIRSACDYELLNRAFGFS